MEDYDYSSRIHSGMGILFLKQKCLFTFSFSFSFVFSTTILNTSMQRAEAKPGETPFPASLFHFFSFSGLE